MGLVRMNNYYSDNSISAPKDIDALGVALDNIITTCGLGFVDRSVADTLPGFRYEFEGELYQETVRRTIVLQNYSSGWLYGRYGPDGDLVLKVIDELPLWDERHFILYRDVAGERFRLLESHAGNAIYYSMATGATLTPSPGNARPFSREARAEGFDRRVGTGVRTVNAGTTDLFVGGYCQFRFEYDNGTNPDYADMRAQILRGTYVWAGNESEGFNTAHNRINISITTVLPYNTYTFRMMRTTSNLVPYKLYWGIY